MSSPVDSSSCAPLVLELILLVVGRRFFCALGGASKDDLGDGASGDGDFAVLCWLSGPGVQIWPFGDCSISEHTETGT